MEQKRHWHMLFWTYCVVMLILLFLLGRSGYDPSVPYREQLRINLIPFRTVALYARILDSANPTLLRLAVINLGGNIIMFIPLGFGISALWTGAESLWKVIAISAAVITAVELAQLVTLVGTCDIDDLILNILGSVIGYWLYKYFAKKTA